MATVLWATAAAPLAPTWTTLPSLAVGGYAISSILDNTTGLHEQALFDFALPSAVTCGTGAPYIGLTALYLPDGTNGPTPPGATAGATGMPQVGTISAVASASFTRGSTGRFEILPFKFRLLITNGLGVAFPATGTFVGNLYRFGETVA